MTNEAENKRGSAIEEGAKIKEEIIWKVLGGERWEAALQELEIIRSGLVDVTMKSRATIHNNYFKIWVWWVVNGACSTTSSWNCW